MTNQTIQELVKDYQNQIKKKINCDIFTLNREVYELQEKITDLQKQCTHEYKDNNICKFCNKEKEGE